MGISYWLRSNAQYYLVEAAERNMARRYGLSGPVGREGPSAWFWRSLFVPVYRILPWSLRRWIMQRMPGSHRRRWHDRGPPYQSGAA